MSHDFPQVGMDPIYGFFHYGMGALCDIHFHTAASGVDNIPRHGGFIIAANHADLVYASAMAAAANTSASKVRKLCIDALITANEQANGAGVKNADGTPMTKPDPSVVADVESFAETVDNLSLGGPLVTNCAGAAQLLKLNTLQLINGIVTGVAAFGVLPIIPIP